ncbi:cilia and flagella-associated protein 47-like [Dunckerocampus dactyliophorus]|uniref:cilia and flagella-associated protein 47-like n=1 Tax=Dunckerocampus dactyliophorus TaxID=161453 RepID=UPI002405D8F8|nr:cilia and flagella-associated protein 47-like [Dunckerocampus dactyliophorus]
MAEGCVQVNPPFVEFKDVQMGQVYKAAITATNAGRTMKEIWFERPKLKIFKFSAPRGARNVAPGLSVSGVLEFTPQREEKITDCINIHVDVVQTIEVPVRVFPRACFLSMDLELDFGFLSASGQMVSRQIPITNQGSASGVFHLQHSGDTFVRLSPCTGVVAAGATKWLNVELHADKPRHVNEKAMVKLQNQPPVVLSIRGQVVDQRLEILDTKGVSLSCLWFGPVYFGTSRVEHVVLNNNGPDACDWVCLLKGSAAGTELGGNLDKSTDAALLARIEQCSQDAAVQCSVLECIPNQGHLGAYKKTTVAVRFSPIPHRLHPKKRGDKASRQDYCLFLHFDTVGSKHGFTHPNGNSIAELAVTGSGLPVAVLPSPSDSFDFSTCNVGHRAERLCVLQNLCPHLSVNFRFRRLAHFGTEPSSGTIAPGQHQDIVLYFSARQQGKFQMCQKLDVLGYVIRRGSRGTSEDDAELKFGSFYTIALYLSAICKLEMIPPSPKLNPGITPEVTNPTGSRPRIPSTELSRCCGMVRAAVLNACKTTFHMHRRRKGQNSPGEVFVALPNDRASSIRPSSPQTQYRTIFTGVHRYSYVDPEYGFTWKELAQRQKHRQSYADFIRQLRQARLQKMKTKQEAQEDDFGIISSQGLVPPKILLSDMEAKQKSKSRPKHASFGRSQGMMPSIGQVSEESHAVPASSQEVADCDRALTAQELYQVVIGPALVDFGEVCVESVCVQNLELTNHLSVFVRVQLEVDCPELQGSSPLSHVLPPGSRNRIPLTFQGHRLGGFYRPVSYSVNQQHPGQILVKAQVVRNYLELSTHLLILGPTRNLLASSGYRSWITLRNPRNQSAEFTWCPIVPESGILFSIRPATGTVEAYRELECEVVWHASFSSPHEGDFDLYVIDGNIQRLHCIAEVGTTSIQQSEDRLMFEMVPLNMPSIRTAVLHNKGHNHAYYRVLDVCPLPCMVVSPCEGVVPGRGKAVLKIQFNPDSVIKFDTRIEIAVRNMKSIEFRVGGSVEAPNVDISVSLFQFHGIHVGSQRVAPFTLSNRSSAAARITFDLSQYPDFTLRLPRSPAKKTLTHAVSVLELQGHQTVSCSLVMSPTEPAEYDFYLPLTVSGMTWPVGSPPPSPSSVSTFLSSGCNKTVVRVLPWSVSMKTQQPRIQATVLCAPLELSPSSLQFLVGAVTQQSHYYTKTLKLQAACEESISWINIHGKSLRWRLECNEMTSPKDAGEEGQTRLFVFPSSGCLAPGQDICLAVSVMPEVTTTCAVKRLSLSFYLGDTESEMREPYKELPITIVRQLPNVTITPSQLLLTPVPLESSITARLNLLLSGYTSGTSLSAEVDEVELVDGTKVQPICVTFPEGNTIPAQDKTASVTPMICRVSFFSTVSLSMCTSITFTDHLNNRFKMKLCATSDNSLLTVWPQMALQRSMQQIVLRAGATIIEPISHHTPSLTSGPTSSSSMFEPSGSTLKDSSSDSFPQSDSGSQVSIQSCLNTDTPRTDIGLPQFPPSTSAEGQYYQDVLLALERWFSLFGWPSGTHPISIPHTLRRTVSKVELSDTVGLTKRVNISKDTRSTVEMIHYLAGRRIPDVPHCQTFSTDINRRTQQLLHQHEVILAFLRVEGACLGHIRAEYLLDVPEFNYWCSLQANVEEPGVDYRSVNYESLSKRCWTEMLLQIYKVLVLARVSESSPNIHRQRCCADDDSILNIHSLPSNLYSRHELQLLSWLNLHYRCMRDTVWASGSVPPVRWIVNFDLDLTDGLVLATALAAYCPYLILSHFQRMYTTTSTLEQILHNNIIVIQALTTLSLNMDLQPTDLADPNPVQMLMLCVHLYERLPQYRPVNTITLSGSLHSTLSKQVQLKNSSTCVVKYRALFLGGDACLFSLPDGSAVTIPSEKSTELTVQHYCSFLQPKEAVLLLISPSASGRHGATLVFNVNTRVGQIKPTKSVKCKSPCYALKVIKLPITNPFKIEANFRVMLVELSVNPLESEKEMDSLIQQASSKAKEWEDGKMTSETSWQEEMEGKGSFVLSTYSVVLLLYIQASFAISMAFLSPAALSCLVCGSLSYSSSACNDKDTYDDGREFLSTVSSVSLKPGQSDIISVHFLPFCPGTKYCAVLLVCPQVGDVVYLVKATADLPLPSLFIVKPSSNIFTIPGNSAGTDGCVSVLRLRCTVGQMCDEVIGLPLTNTAWENGLAIWAQHRMSATEFQRRMLTYTLHSSTVRTSMAACMLSKKQVQLRGVDHSKGIEYSVEVSLPLYFSVPSTVTIPLKKDVNIWKNPTDHECVKLPLRFRADCVGQFTCKMVLRSCFDTRVYLMEALVASPGGSVHLDFSSPAQHSVTQDIPLHNETLQDWTLHAQLVGKGFYGPQVLIVPAGTRTCYPLTFHPSSQCVVMGKLSLYNDRNGIEQVFTLRGVGERPLPVDHVVLHCPVGKTTVTELSVPNYSQTKRSLKVVTDLSFVSGNSSLEVKPGQSSMYIMAVSPRKQGQQSGCVSFIESDDTDDTEVDKGDVVGRYEVFYTLEIFCEPAAPVSTFTVQCTVQRSVTIEIPVTNPGEELLMLNVDLEGDDLHGASWVSVPPQETLPYKVMFSPGRIGKSTGSVIFQSELSGEFWYQLEFYAIPSPVVTLPQVCCQLGKWTSQSIPVVNPTADKLELIVANSNPRNYTLEVDSGSTFTVEPHSSTQLGVRFTPSSIGEGNHVAKITFTCPQMQQWCVLLFGRGLMPGREEPLSISCTAGSSESITIPFTNPTEHPATLCITLTEKDPSGAPDCRPVTPDKGVFSLSLSHAEGIQISGGGSLDVPVVFAPKSMDPQQAWLRITMKPLNVTTRRKRSGQKLSTICWIYPLCGIPVKALDDNSPLCVLQCEAGCQLEKVLDVLLTGCVPGAQNPSGNEVSPVLVEDFQCEVRSDSEEDCLSASIEAGRRDPKTGVVTLTMKLIHTPVKKSRYSALLVVQHASGHIWEFPLDVIATEPRVDDVIVTEATEFGKTSAVGFYLTSTTRRPEPFVATFQPGSSSEFAVTPTSGMLPPVDSSGALINVFFTPAVDNKRHSARLGIKASGMQWTYYIRGITPPLSALPSNVRSPVQTTGRTNFVARNLRVPALANSAPLKARR